MAAAPDPLWECLLSAYRLNQPRASLGLEHWRQEVRYRLPEEVRPFLELVPRDGYSPDFLTPHAAGFEAGIDLVLSTPRHRLRADLERLATGPSLPANACAMAEGDPAALRRLGAALRTYHRQAVAPLWATIEAQVRTERNRLARLLLDGGVERAFGSLRVTAHWESPVLTLVSHPADRDLHLDGRGLILVPAFFCWRRPVTLADPERPPVLVYPVEHGIDQALAGAITPPGQEAHLARLVGRTRAAVLQALAESATTTTTTELARRLRISLASASEHAGVLRAAALTSSYREGKTVHHSLTPLGRGLLNQHGR